MIVQLNAQICELTHCIGMHAKNDMNSRTTIECTPVVKHFQ